MDEYERTYLLKLLPEGVLKSPSKLVFDIYIPQAGEHPTLRIRNSGETLEITKKIPVDDIDRSHQIEKTIKLTEEEYKDFLQIPGKRVSKTRYLYEENGRTYEVDIFNDDLKGLVLVDVEFNSNEEKANFTAPDWLGVEVTHDRVFAGGMLCGKKYSDIEEKLKVYNYIKLS